MKLTADTITDEQIRELRCEICGNPATCVGNYEDMPYPGEPACDECCGHGCEDGHCEPLFDHGPDPKQKRHAARAKLAEIWNRHYANRGPL